MRKWTQAQRDEASRKAKERMAQGSTEAQDISEATGEINIDGIEAFLKGSQSDEFRQPEQPRYLAFQLDDGWIYPAHLLQAVRLNTSTPGRYAVEVKLHGDAPNEPPRLRSMHYEHKEAVADGQTLLNLFCDDVSFAPVQLDPAPVMPAPQPVDPNPLKVYHGENVGSFSGWHEEDLIRAPAPPQQSRVPGYGMGPAQPRGPMEAGNTSQDWRNSPILSKPAGGNVAPPGDPDLLREIDAMGGRPPYARR